MCFLKTILIQWVVCSYFYSPISSTNVQVILILEKLLLLILELQLCFRSLKTCWSIPLWIYILCLSAKIFFIFFSFFSKMFSCQCDVISSCVVQTIEWRKTKRRKWGRADKWTQEEEASFQVQFNIKLVKVTIKFNDFNLKQITIMNTLSITRCHRQIFKCFSNFLKNQYLLNEVIQRYSFCLIIFSYAVSLLHFENLLQVCQCLFYSSNHGWNKYKWKAFKKTEFGYVI